MAQIAAGIAEFGFNAPLLVDSKPGIIAGHGRVLAARMLGLAEVPVIVLDHLSDTVVGVLVAALRTKHSTLLDSLGYYLLGFSASAPAASVVTILEWTPFLRQPVNP